MLKLLLKLVLIFEILNLLNKILELIFMLYLAY